MVRYAILSCAGLVLCSCASAKTQATAHYLAPGRYQQTIEIGGMSRHFILRIPTSVDTTKPAPLVVVLHGWTASAALAEAYTKMAAQAEKSGFIVAFPDGLGQLQGWNAGFIDLSGKKGDDVGFISGVIDKVESESDIDVDRVYVAGHSNGAFMADLLGAKIGSRLAAIGVVAGTIGIPSSAPGGYTMIPTPTSPVSVIAIHSRKDVMVAYDKSSSALLRCYPAPEAAMWWAKQDGCIPTPKVTKNATGTVETSLYSGGKNGTEVELVTLTNGSHDWPGGLTRDGEETDSGLDAAQTLWDFFVAHPRAKS